MKKIIIINFILFNFICCFAYCATNGKVLKVLQEGDYRVYKYVVDNNMTDNETFAFYFTGSIYRIVIDANTTDPDGEFVMEDISEANYVDWKHVLASKSNVGYVLECSTINGNIGLSYPVAGQQKGTLRNMAGAAPLTIWIYCNGVN
ncbi:MAG: hypothetical protein A2Y10_04440 [Planctomycetes bacterium GWF2_41_51]|nr:MAG: hypothetical protein A2Y10_04440 [Planctomycetes bacterium GWF2_41_51]HBG27034.1 hypothetical protein [Phycisphaerales bacterium]